MSARQHSVNTYDDDDFEDLSKSHISASKQNSKKKPNHSDSYSMTFEESVRSDQGKKSKPKAANEHGTSEKKISPIREELKETSMGSQGYSSDGESGSTEKANPKMKHTLKHEDTDSMTSDEPRHPVKPKVGELVIEKGRGQTTISVSGLSSSMLPKGGDVESQLGTEEESESSSMEHKENHIWA